MLLIALRESGRLVQASAPANGTLARVPKRMFQFWDEPEPPSEIVELMNSWKARHPDFTYIRFDDAGARQFPSVHGLADALQAYRDAREPAQRADIFRLACLAIYGGVYADADDRCLAHVASFVPADAQFVAYQEHFGTLGNNFLAVTPEHPVIRLALQGACEALKRGDFGCAVARDRPRSFDARLCPSPVARDLAVRSRSGRRHFRHGRHRAPYRLPLSGPLQEHRRVRRVRAPTFDIGDDTSAADPRA